ncbi:MAG TPA: SDR family oxidoreductase [Acidimicrobiales bacterium]|nr:SDR family oxidoreductase [Acidimicrobiales bacterium]
MIRGQRSRRSVVVVTGGGSGIGFALARRLHAEGARVAIVDRHGDGVGGATELLDGSVGYTADVTDEAVVTEVVAKIEARLGPIDVYCSNAGVPVGHGLGSDEEWSEAWATHALAHVYAARAVLPKMAARGSGHFVVTAAASGLLMMMQSAPYTVSNHAAVSLAEWLAVEYGDSGVGIHCVAPQGVRTPMVTRDAGVLAEVTASGAIIDPVDVAEAVMTALAENRFLVLPHPAVQDYERAKVHDRDAWLAGLRELRKRI